MIVDGRVEELPVVVVGAGPRIAHLWLRDRARPVSTLDLLGNGLTLLTGPRASAWRSAAASMRPPVPLAVRSLDELTARALGIAGPGALLVRPDGLPAGLWTQRAHAAGELRSAVASVTAGHLPRSEPVADAA